MATDMLIAANDVSQRLLDITGDALLSGDFDAFASVFHAPQHMATMAGPIYMETTEDMRRAFVEMHNHLRGIGATDTVRKCVVAEYKTPTRIEATHTNEVLRHGTRLSGPYPCFSVLEKIDGNWKVTGSEYALEPNDGQAMAIAYADTKHRNA
ncbi:hypothetical protein [Roseobacter sp. CCS2]|uniref:hypothetical protein n=1 Tax=Roseobacter sp. CCS2 TaxID=391593 RepID=UPI0000F4036C|nr:hypothetical protein [Roseobacter sp. CCS2]EBA12974.1 hypothetical protein RCCS2_03794 [Roseobacter sp. CCS2]